VLHAHGDTAIDLRDDVAAVGPDPAEVRVRIKATGVCHSDLSAMSGVLRTGLPAVLGHEGAGEVIEVGSQVTSVRPGDHVVISWTPACGLCPECRRGQPYLCLTYVRQGFTKPRFTFADDIPAFGMAGTGTWAEELVLPWQGAIRIDPDVPFELAALLGCGIPTGLGAVFNTAHVAPGSSVAVIGCGGVGLTVIQGARIAGAAKICAIDPLPHKHELARRFGATHTATPDALDQAKIEVTGGQGFDYAFEVVGTGTAIRTAWQAARRGGDVIVVGAGAAGDMVGFSAFELLFHGKNILSSLYGGSDLGRDMRRFIDLWRAGKLDIEGLISRRIKFEQLNEATAALSRGEVVRQVLTFD
jgi:S-(hydroxymethyl)glutathione dehydrogenase/alcohol dehydrogenase